MAKKEPKIETYRLTFEPSAFGGQNGFFTGVISGNDVRLCAEAMRNLFELGRSRTIHLKVSNVRPTDNNFHFIRQRNGELRVTGLDSKIFYGDRYQTVPSTPTYILAQDFPGSKTLYLWCH